MACTLVQEWREGSLRYKITLLMYVIGILMSVAAIAALVIADATSFSPGMIVTLVIGLTLLLLGIRLAPGEWE